MLNKDEVIAQFTGDVHPTYRSVAVRYGVSRQRIAQIVSGYKNINRALRKVVLARDGYACQSPNPQCRRGMYLSKDLIIHRIDGDPLNNKVENLVTLCRLCDAYIHKITTEDKLTKYRCSDCDVEFTKNNGTVAQMVCRLCIEKRKAEREKYWSFKHRLMACNRCGLSVSKHQGHGVCVRCVAKERYQKPGVKERHKMLVRRWKKENPERAAQIQKAAAKRYWKKNKAKMIAREKVYRQGEHYKKWQKQYYETVAKPRKKARAQETKTI